ncbi:hypothetical protein B0T10DRAFT_225463 [Thelonectria olida]|uniref:Uncharacterized protein n=1 Tax=Thelonectria olida TaxID=1576542 RepID=A0A9P8WDA2_9HYPO|nr:hypothetical protein B0T10DRAFT_225463 [Thelonectria olida]
MSFISRLKRSRAPKEQDKATEKSKSKSKSKETKTQTKPAYHHKPSHAAADAASMAPSGSRVADNARVREVNRERRAMHSHEYQATLQSIPRVDSSMSTATYTGSEASSSRSPRHYSMASSSAASSAQSSISHKGKEVDRRGAHHERNERSERTKRYSGEKAEIRSIRMVRGDVEPITIPRPHTAVAHPHHLHPSARSPSEVSVDRVALDRVAQLASTPLSQRNRSSQNKSLPPVPLTPTKPPITTKKRSSTPTDIPTPPITRGHTRNGSGGYSSFWERHSRQGSVSSLPALTPTSTKHHSAGPMTPQKSSSKRHSSSGHRSLDAADSHYLNFDFQFEQASTRSSYATPEEKQQRRRSSRTRYQEKEIIDPTVNQLDFGLPSKRGRDAAPSPLTPEYIVNRFPEPVDADTPSKKSKSWKKAGAKLLRKNTKRIESR